MSTTADFWEGYDATLARVRAEKPATLDALAVILNAFQPPSSGVAFFGNNSDDTIAQAISEAGWHVRWIEHDYLWQATSPSGEVIHYVEGDLYRGPWKVAAMLTPYAPPAYPAGQDPRPQLQEWAEATLTPNVANMARQFAEEIDPRLTPALHTLLRLVWCDERFAPESRHATPESG